MTDQEIRTIVRQTVHETLQSIGIDTADPIKAQRNFQFLTSWRESADAIKRQAVTTTIIVLVTGALALVALWIRGGGIK